MARKLNEKLMKQLRKGGEWERIMIDVNKDPDLSPEIRKGELKIYYQKGLILTLSGTKIVTLDPGYFPGQEMENFNPINPSKYFKWAKKVVGFYNYKSGKKEFGYQQRIAQENSSIDSKFLVIDMEYQYSQEHIPEALRVDRTRIDIVAIEKATNEIVLFELKQGKDALEGKSGVEDHVKKTKTLLGLPDFCNNLRKDVVHIIKQKNELGILNCSDELLAKIEQSNVKMGVIFIANNAQENAEFRKYDTLLKSENVLTIYKDFSCVL